MKIAVAITQELQDTASPDIYQQTFVLFEKLNIKILKYLNIWRINDDLFVNK